MAKVFISYRRIDARQDAGRLSDALVRAFGEDNVFMDLASIEPGKSFLAEIDEAIDASDVVLVVIGRQWLTVVGEDGKRRLDDPDDAVRMEVAAAMARARSVIPVLVQGAPMPDESDLPPPLLPLRGYQACELSDLRWNYDVQRLIDAIEAIAPSPGQQALRTAGQVFPFLRRPRVRWGLALAAAALGAWLGWSRFGRQPDAATRSAAPVTAPAGAPAPLPPSTASADPGLLFALPASAEDGGTSQIRSVRLLGQADDAVRLEVAYHYAGDFGANNVIILVEGLDVRGETRVTSQPSPGVGVGTGTVRVTMRAVKSWLPFDTTAFRVAYFRMTESAGNRSYDQLTDGQSFSFTKSWK
jgi:hypothetical protein